MARKPVGMAAKGGGVDLKYAEWPSLAIYDRLGVPYVVTSDAWHGPLWTGHCMMLSTEEGYGDAGFFHELAHWVMASPEQRRYPDFALGRQVNADYGLVFTSSSTPWLNNPRAPKTATHNAGWGEPTVSRAKAKQQENWACHVLALYEPATGVWGWDKVPGDVASRLNPALYDFAGSAGPQFDRKTAAGLAKYFSGVFFEADAAEVFRYLQLLKEGLTDRD